MNAIIERIAPGDLKPSPRNARTHDRRQIGQIVESIRAFGFTNPLLIDEDNVVVAGHGRLAAAKELGLDQVPAIRITHLSASENRALRLADNKIALNAGWDLDLLAAELADLSSMDLEFDLDVTGFEAAEIDLILEDGPKDELGEPEETPLPDRSRPPIVRPGDLWQHLGRHRVLCGDARNADDYARLMENRWADMGFTDPPYNVPIAGHVEGRVRHREFAEASGGAVKGNWLEPGWGPAYRPGMSTPNPFRYFKTSPEIIRLAVMLYLRFPLSLRNVEDLLHERGIDISHETVRFWWHRFGPMFAAEIRKRRIEGMKSSRWRWHLDEMFVKINGETHYLWRAVDHEGEVLESFVTRTRDKKAALKFLRKAMRKHGQPEVIVTDRLRSYSAALREIGAGARQETGRWANNRAENSHLPFRRRERVMLRFRRMRSLQKFAAVHASVSNHFNQERSLSRRNTFKDNRAAALAEWRGLLAA